MGEMEELRALNLLFQLFVVAAYPNVLVVVLVVVAVAVVAAK